MRVAVLKLRQHHLYLISLRFMGRRSSSVFSDLLSLFRLPNVVSYFFFFFFFFFLCRFLCVGWFCHDFGVIILRAVYLSDG